MANFEQSVLAKLQRGNPAKIWPFLRCEIGKMVTGDKLVPVPDLTQTEHYDLFCIFVKSNKNALDKIKKPNELYRMVGHLADLCDKDKSNIDLILHAGKPTEEQLKLPPIFEWSTGSEKVGKQIELKVTGLRKTVVPFTLAMGDLVLDMKNRYLKDAKSVYIISDVLYADSLELKQVVDNYVNDLGIKGPLSLGFAYRKFALQPDGTVGPQLNTKIRLHSNWETMPEGTKMSKKAAAVASNA